MKNKIFLIAVWALLLVGNTVQAGTPVKFDVRLGYNIGGTLPLPIPSEMESVNSFNPGLNLGVQGTMECGLNDMFGVRVGLRGERKSMSTDATVANYHTKMTGDDGSETEGNFTGQQSMKSAFMQLSLPVQAVCHISDKWAVAFGPYISYNLSKEFSGAASNGYMRTLREDPLTGKPVPTGDKVIMTPENPAKFDFSDDLRNIQFGLELGADYQITSNILAFLHLDWGLNDVFKDSFEETISFPMYPVFGMIGVGYSF